MVAPTRSASDHDGVVRQHGDCMQRGQQRRGYVVAACYRIGAWMLAMGDHDANAATDSHSGAVAGE